MNDIWILAETKGGKVAPVSFELLAWARSLGGNDEISVTAILPGPASDPDELCYRGADRVVHCPAEELAGYSARPLARFLASLFEPSRPAVLLAAATATGRTALPYLAASEGLGLTADCTQLALDARTGELSQTRPAAGGNIMATIRTSRGRPQMATVRPHSRRPLVRDATRSVTIEVRAAPRGDGRDGLELLEERPFPSSRGIADARAVVAGGKGFRRKEGFRLLEDLAGLMGAEVGASREAVDRGWAEYPRQVGLSGRTISPDLYVAFGISGAIQHLAGMQTAGTIVSVNTDPDAPIVAISDLAIRADLYELIPALARRLADCRRAE
jgi:electron transfer flavoprotein alpha subunit